MEIPGLDPAAPNRFMKVPVWAFKMYWIRSGKICTAVGSSGHYIRMFPAGPEVTTPDVIALRGAVWDEIQFYPGFPGHLYHKSNDNLIRTVMLAVSTITHGQRHCLLSKTPNDGGADPRVAAPQSWFPFWKRGRPRRQVDKLVMLHMHIPATIPCYPPTGKKSV